MSDKAALLETSETIVNEEALKSDGVGCHAGADQMKAAAKKAGKSEIL